MSDSQLERTHRTPFDPNGAGDGVKPCHNCSQYDITCEYAPRAQRRKHAVPLCSVQDRFGIESRGEARYGYDATQHLNPKPRGDVTGKDDARPRLASSSLLTTTAPGSTRPPNPPGWDNISGSANDEDNISSKPQANASRPELNGHDSQWTTLQTLLQNMPNDLTRDPQSETLDAALVPNEPKLLPRYERSGSSEPDALLLWREASVAPRNRQEASWPLETTQAQPSPSSEEVECFKAQSSVSFMISRAFNKF